MNFVCNVLYRSAFLFWKFARTILQNSMLHFKFGFHQDFSGHKMGLLFKFKTALLFINGFKSSHPLLSGVWTTAECELLRRRILFCVFDIIEIFYSFLFLTDLQSWWCFKSRMILIYTEVYTMGWVLQNSDRFIIA